MLALMARAPSLRSQLSLDHKQLAGAGTLNDQQQDFPEHSRAVFDFKSIVQEGPMLQ